MTLLLRPATGLPGTATGSVSFATDRSTPRSEASQAYRPSLWSQLFSGCRCAPQEDEIVLADCGARECGCRPVGDFAEDDYMDVRPTLEQVGGLRGMALRTAEGVVIPEACPEDEVRILMADLMHLRADLFSARAWELEYLKDDLYSINGRTIRIYLLPPGMPPPDCRHISSELGAGTAHMATGIMILDGPLQQPLWDYLMQTGLNENYDMRGTENPAAVSGAARNLDLGFPSSNSNERIDAMRHAVVEADLRHRVTVSAPIPCSRTSSGSELDDSVNLELASSHANGPSRLSQGKVEGVGMRPGPSRFSKGRCAMGGA